MMRRNSRTIKKFIKDKKQLFIYSKNYLLNNQGLRDNWRTFAGYIINILVTGSVVYIIVHWPDNPAGYGLLVFMVTYYVQWLIKLIKTPYENFE